MAGEPYVGKTKLTARFVGENFEAKTKGTIGVDYKQTNYKTPNQTTTED